jgi:hypothetical protein
MEAGWRVKCASLETQLREADAKRHRLERKLK